MKPFELWKKIIIGKVYTKEAATIRVNTVFVVGQLTPEEYTELIQLIEVKYPDVA